MAINVVKYSTSSIANATLVGNVAFGWDGYDYGPSETSGWYAGVTPPVGGYVIYATSASQIVSATVINDSSSLFDITDQLYCYSQSLYYSQSFSQSFYCTQSYFSSSAQAQGWLNSNGYAVATQVYGGGVVTSGLQLYLNAGNVSSYPGSGNNWYDLSTNNYTASLINTPGYTSSDGGTLTFNGATQYVDTNQSLASNEFSVGAWFKSSVGGIKMILSKETTTGWPWNYRIWLNGGTIIGDIALSGGTNVSITSPLSSYNNGNWYNVMFTRNDSTLRLYVNGIEVTNTPDTLTGAITNSQEVWIGRSAFTAGGLSPTGNYPYNGSISEIMIYNRVLSASEILQNFDATKTRFGL